jgi:hypothetical protein
MHWLVFSQACLAMDLHGQGQALAAAWFAAMILAPAAQAGRWWRPFSALAYGWMGLVFYLFLGSIPLAVLGALAGPSVQRPAFWVLAATSLGLCLYGLVNARQIRVRRLVLATDTLPPGLEKIGLAVISDVHLYSVEAGSRLRRVLAVLGTLEFDVLLSLGDLIEVGAHRGDWMATAGRLALLRPRLGKYAVNGNHEAYANHVAGQDFSAKFHEAAGFDLLRGQTACPGREIRLAGLDYRGATPGSSPVTGQDLAAKLDQEPGAGPSVLLKHEPVLEPGTEGVFDLQLSGHTHCGQMWPFYYLVKAMFPRLKGLYDLDGAGKLYVSTGTGTWGPPMRIGTTPEITLVTFVRS